MAAAALALAATFNLICSATMTMDGKSSQQTVTIHVDLAQKIFCRDDCNATFPIKDVTRSRIIFADGQDRETGLVRYMRVSRENGSFIELSEGTIAGKHISSSIFGTCTKATFTGFPAQLF